MHSRLNYPPERYIADFNAGRTEKTAFVVLQCNTDEFVRGCSELCKIRVFYGDCYFGA